MSARRSKRSRGKTVEEEEEEDVVAAPVEAEYEEGALISIRISARPHKLTIIQAYAPTSGHGDEEVEEFYDQLEATIAKVPRKDLMMVQGYWNAKVGPDAYENWAGTVGRFGMGDTNDRGIRLLEFAKSHCLTLANTLHPKNWSRTVTWHSPNGQVHNQIDFILVPQRFKSSINKANTRTFPGADIGSDHDLVLTTIKLKLNSKYPEAVEIFKAQVGGKFAVLSVLDNDIDTLAGNIKEVLLTTADEVLGKQQKRSKPWVTTEVLDLCDKRRELRHAKHTSHEARIQYREMNREVRKKVKAAKEDWIEAQCKVIDKGLTAGNIKEAYNTLKDLIK
ncbi:uncharacterized protein [Diadema antillarum]|uniref:uncharacterized protein n=1 Tax=Diadema antillarum TaxID=105358 RepID=UPI003A8A953A